MHPMARKKPWLSIGTLIRGVANEVTILLSDRTCYRFPMTRHPLP
jgi:hypothetical protein